MKKLSVFLVILFISVHVTFAQTDEWKVDKAHSRVMFSVSHLVISEVTGYFKDFDITVKSDKDDFTDLSIEGRIRVSSINTENERRDNHLRSDDFFNAEKYPEIIFKSTSIEKIGERNYKIHGDLTIRDITKPCRSTQFFREQLSQINLFERVGKQHSP